MEDIGFDLTHPNFYSRDLSTYRISRFWDMLAPSDGSGSVYLGAEFTFRETILQQAHSRDGLDQTHGTHTAGIAAGSGYTSRYQGIAPESELCLVSNAVTEDTVFISKEDFYRFTTATDALGFKYIFDYADQVGKPCVISFSEGSTDMLRSSNLLFYEVLERMTGPGRIFVTAAGNTATSSPICPSHGAWSRQVASFLITAKRYATNSPPVALSPLNSVSMLIPLHLIYIWPPRNKSCSSPTLIW